MFTPAMSASSTSSPATILRKASSTQVRAPPFLNWCPFSDAITTGPVRRVRTAGAWANSGLAPAAIAVAALFRTKSRRLSFSVMGRLLAPAFSRGDGSDEGGVDRKPRTAEVQGGAENRSAYTMP